MPRSSAVLLVLPTLLLAAQACEKDPVLDPGDLQGPCQPVLQPAGGPFVMPAEPGQGYLRWESVEADAPVACVDWTTPDGAVHAMEVTSRVIFREHPPLETGGEDYVARVYSAAVALTASGDYAWSVATAAGAAVNGTFRQPARTDRARVFVIGDTNNSNEATRNVDGTVETVDITETMIAEIATGDIDLYLHLGDIVYNASLPLDDWPRFWDINRELMRRSVFLPVVGNHEYEFEDEYEAYVAPTFSRPNLAPGVAEVLVSDTGPLRLITFNSNRDELNDEEIAAMWLDVEAALVGAGDRWKVLVMHHPIYTESEHAPVDEFQQKAKELDAEYDIDLVLSGHNHVYERFSPSHFHAIVSGGGGAFLYGLNGNDPLPEAPRAASAAAFHAVILEALGDEIELTATDLAGRTIDEATLGRR